MSQHYVYTQLDGEKVVVMLGWDRPLSGYFMVVIRPFEHTDEDGETYPDEEYLYSNIEDPNLRLGLSSRPTYFKEKLTELGITIPDKIFHIIDNDGQLNKGNDVHFYDIVNDTLHHRKKKN